MKLNDLFVQFGGIKNLVCVSIYCCYYCIHLIYFEIVKFLDVNNIYLKWIAWQ